MAAAGAILCLLSIVQLIVGDKLKNNGEMSLSGLQQTVADLQETVSKMARQMMLQQQFVEERIRTDGQSGIKAVRVLNDGTAPYYVNSFSSMSAVAAIHDHSNYDRTVGIGEVSVVINGVDFRTRHNDYKLRMPSRSTKTFHKTVDIRFPDVPASVSRQPSVQEQIREMQMYFKAFQWQDPSIRNYQPFFKPVLCYMEGAWTKNTETVVEPFDSDRHFIDSITWEEMQEKIRFTSFTGDKSRLENYSYLPTTIINVTTDGQPVYAQWNYRIVCHPIKHPLHLSNFKLVDDLKARISGSMSRDDLGLSRAARFTLSADSVKHKYYPELGYGTFDDESTEFSLLDKLMAEVPGKDNYPSHIEDDTFGVKYSMERSGYTKLNAGYYHRRYKSKTAGAMGQHIRHRGFSDQNMWTAETRSPYVAEMEITDCPRGSHPGSSRCETHRKRFSYAIPLEIVWLTPLSNWNPYNVHTYSSEEKDMAKTVTSRGRNGGMTKDTAFNGTSFRHFYRTPAEFFQSRDVHRDEADTARESVGVLDKRGLVRKMTATGPRIILPEIPDVGTVRMRYPIMPMHVEGSAEWKEIAALRDVVFNRDEYSKLFSSTTSNGPSWGGNKLHFKTTLTHKQPPGMHYHDVYLPEEKVMDLRRNGGSLKVYTSEANGHRHHLELRPAPGDPNRLLIAQCDEYTRCEDGHGIYVFETNK